MMRDLSRVLCGSCGSSGWSREPARLARALAVLLVLFVYPTSCGLFDDSDRTVTVDGVVQFSPIEGGCWSILGEDGTRYEPINLPQEFQQDGLAVRAALKFRDDMASICQVGRIVEIVRIERRDAGP